MVVIDNINYHLICHPHHILAAMLLSTTISGKKIVGRYTKRFRDGICKYSVGLLTNNNKNKIPKNRKKKQKKRKSKLQSSKPTSEMAEEPNVKKQKLDESDETESEGKTTLY